MSWLRTETGDGGLERVNQSSNGADVDILSVEEGSQSGVREQGSCAAPVAGGAELSMVRRSLALVPGAILVLAAKSVWPRVTYKTFGATNFFIGGGGIVGLFEAKLLGHRVEGLSGVATGGPFLGVGESFGLHLRRGVLVLLLCH